MKKVSIVIPVYNNEKYVEKCIDSLLRQTYTNIEILIINDGSNDGSKVILERLSLVDNRIRLFHQKNGGVAKARNKGISEATGEYLTFVDGDDYISETYIENFITEIERTQADMLICGISYVDENGKLLGRLIPDEYIKNTHEEWVFRISAVCSHFYRRDIWEKYNIRFQSGARGEDLPISLFFGAVCKKIGVIPEAGYYYVQHSSSARHNFRGLKNYNLPYAALEEILLKLQNVGVVNSHDFHELFVLRILATCFFDLGIGAPKDKMKELCDYIVRILDTYFPNYYKNKLTGLFSDVRVPVVQKGAVWLLVKLVRTRLIYPVSCLLRRG